MIGRRPIEPAKPEGVEIIFFYACPYCGRKNPLLATDKPSMARCDSCSKNFPVLPVDARSVRFVKLMFANGKAAIDPDFM